MIDTNYRPLKFQSKKSVKTYRGSKKSKKRNKPAKLVECPPYDCVPVEDTTFDCMPPECPNDYLVKVFFFE